MWPWLSPKPPPSPQGLTGQETLLPSGQSPFCPSSGASPRHTHPGQPWGALRRKEEADGPRGQGWGPCSACPSGCSLFLPFPSALCLASFPSQTQSPKLPHWGCPLPLTQGQAPGTSTPRVPRSEWLLVLRERSVVGPAPARSLEGCRSGWGGASVLHKT